MIAGENVEKRRLGGVENRDVMLEIIIEKDKDILVSQLILIKSKYYI